MQLGCVKGVGVGVGWLAHCETLFIYRPSLECSITFTTPPPPRSFYSAVSASGLADAVQSLSSGGVPPRWVVIDDGWQCTEVRLSCSAKRSGLVCLLVAQCSCHALPLQRWLQTGCTTALLLVSRWMSRTATSPPSSSSSSC